ncbi:MAG TPA: hypothetical protein VFH47_03885 [Candidatus Thermoplasmatota archaeon]|nr:hypothetical protein [Candidatus Thermoplasmatota archaeon]
MRRRLPALLAFCVMASGCVSSPVAAPPPPEAAAPAWEPLGAEVAAQQALRMLVQADVAYLVAADAGGVGLFRVPLDGAGASRLADLPAFQDWSLAWPEGGPLWLRGSSHWREWGAVPHGDGMHGDGFATKTVHAYLTWSADGGLVQVRREEGETAVAGSALVAVGGSLFAAGGVRGSGWMHWGDMDGDVRRVGADGVETRVASLPSAGPAVGGGGWVVVDATAVRVDGAGQPGPVHKSPCAADAAADALEVAGTLLVAGAQAAPCRDEGWLVAPGIDGWKRSTAAAPWPLAQAALASWGAGIVAATADGSTVAFHSLPSALWTTNRAPTVTPTLRPAGAWVDIQAGERDADGDAVRVVWQGPGWDEPDAGEVPAHGGGGGSRPGGLRVPYEDGATYVLDATDAFGASATATVTIRGRPDAGVRTFACGPQCVERRLPPMPAPADEGQARWHSAGVGYNASVVHVGWSRADDGSPATVRWAQVFPSGAQQAWREAPLVRDPWAPEEEVTAVAYEWPPVGECAVFRLQPHRDGVLLQSSELRVCSDGDSSGLPTPYVDDDWA